jgi:Ni/Fe-hydrogenase 1 B-type cytochrome subunit
MAGSVYLFIFLLYLLMICTGFALYSEHAPGSLLNRAFGLLFALFSNQTLRLLHHGSMWLIICFAINHVYSSILMDVKEKNGGISSIFSGYKFVPEED